MAIDAAIEELLRLDPGLQRQVVERYASSPTSFGSEFFARIVNESNDPICRWYAIRALGDLTAKEQLGTLISVIQAPDEAAGSSSLHLIAARSIGQIGSAALEALLPLLRTAKGDTLVAVVDSLGEIGSETAIPELARCFKFGERKVALWAALSLGKIGVPAISTLHNLCRSADKTSAYLIIDALVAINHPTILPAIVIAYERFPDALLNYVSQGPRLRVERLVALVHQEATKPGQTAFAARKLAAAIRRN